MNNQNNSTTNYSTDNPADGDQAAPAQTGKADEERKAFPDFDLTTFDNQKVSLSALKGKPAFVRFSTTHCSICKAENPMLNQVGEELGDQVKFLDVNIGEQAPIVNGYVKEQKITHQIALDLDSSLTAQLGILGTPTHFALDSEGRICFKSTGRISEEELRKVLKDCGS